MKRKLIPILLTVAVLVLVLCFFPFPQKVSKTFQGVSIPYGIEDEQTPCTVSLEGTCKRYLFKEDEYSGVFAISTDARTSAGAAELTQVVMGEGRPSMMFYYTNPGYFVPGYFITNKTLDWLYLRVKDEQGNVHEIFLPSDAQTDLSALREKALHQLDFPCLPSIGQQDDTL